MMKNSLILFFIFVAIYGVVGQVKAESVMLSEDSLDKITHSWNRKMSAPKRFKFVRFKLVMNKEAVLDRETGLVWERSPSTEPMAWTSAVYYAFNKIVGGRKGWRLPTVEELASLVDPNESNPALPRGHPFIIQSVNYWSATSNFGLAGGAFAVFMGNGYVGPLSNDYYYVWCVRGGYGYNYDL